MSKEFLFNRGIQRTHWKSIMLEEKLNPLRVALDLLEREAPLTRTQYDKEVVDALKNTDFRELDTNCISSWFCCIGLSNTIKHVVLNFAGLGLTDVDAEHNLIGDIHPHLE
ncbi:MAG: hypothetical protein AB8B66_03970 [Rickettsiaceae bacterium]